MRTCQPVRWACHTFALTAIMVLLPACKPAAVPAAQPAVVTQAAVTPLNNAAWTRTPALETPTRPAVTGIPSSPDPDLSAPPAPFDADPRQAALISFILTDLAGTEKQHLLVAQVQPNAQNPLGKLNLSADNILRAWIFKDDELHDCPPDFFAQSYRQETGSPWKYAYLAFSLNQVSSDASTASVRVDRIPGRAGGRGALFDLAREGERWSVKSHRNAWIQ